MLLNLLVAAGLVAVPLVACIWLAYRASRFGFKGRVAWLAITAALVVVPYVYSQGRMLYRNTLCEEVSTGTLPSTSEPWESQRLNARYSLETQVVEHGFGLFHIHRRVVEADTQHVVAQTVAFYSPSGFLVELYPFAVEARGCSQADSDFERQVSRYRSAAPYK